MACVAATRELSPAGVRRPALALIALGSNLAVTLPLAWILNIWQDEAYTLQTTSGSLAYAFHQALAFEQNAPLYFVFLTAWRHLGSSIFFLRLPSVLCVALAVALVPGLARRYVPAIDPGIATVVAAGNPFAIWAAVEMRVYAMVIALSALLLLTFFDAFLDRRPSRGSAVAYAACCILALYTQYYLGFLIAAQAVAVLVLQRRAFGRFALCAAAAGLAFSPMLVIVPSQVANFKSAFTPPTLTRAVEVLGFILARYALPLPTAHARIAYIAAAALVVAAAVCARKHFSADGNGAILVVTGLTFAFFAVVSYAAGVHVLDRHAASLYLPCVLSVFAVFTYLKEPLGTRAAVAWACVVLLASTATILLAYRPLAKPGDWIRATAYLRAHERPNEPIVVFQAENALPLGYYYRGPNRIVPIPRGVDFRRYDVTRFVLRDASDIEASWPSQRRLWLVEAGECASANVRFGCDVLEAFVAKRYRVESSASFYEARLRLLERRNP
jgi:Dolichyl-phosphate-mannose-protein mannosyltransferase